MGPNIHASSECMSSKALLQIPQKNFKRFFGAHHHLGMVNCNKFRLTALKMGSNHIFKTFIVCCHHTQIHKHNNTPNSSFTYCTLIKLENSQETDFKIRYLLTFSPKSNGSYISNNATNSILNPPFLFNTQMGEVILEGFLSGSFPAAFCQKVYKAFCQKSHGAF